MLNIRLRLNEELGIRIYSFPMRFQPTDMKDRSFIGKKWNKYKLRSMQIILQATHGIVSGAPSFFKELLGKIMMNFKTYYSDLKTFYLIVHGTMSVVEGQNFRNFLKYTRNLHLKIKMSWVCCYRL